MIGFAVKGRILADFEHLLFLLNMTLVNIIAFETIGI